MPNKRTNRDKNAAQRRAFARDLCRQFEGTELLGAARPGLEVLESDHKTVITDGSSIACGVALDRCRRELEPEADRWDYVFTERRSDRAIGIEVHHATAEEVDKMIAKKEWAKALLAAQCPSVTVVKWLWIAPPEGDIFFSALHPFVRRLAEAGVEFPIKRVARP